MSMDDLISRQAAIDAIVNTVSEIGLYDNSEEARYGATFRQHEIIDIIEGMPSAQPERNTGKWIYDGVRGRFPACRCSVCGNIENADWVMISGEVNYCTKCGAKMN